MPDKKARGNTPEMLWLDECSFPKDMVVCSHHPCLDGFGSRLAFYLKYGSAITYLDGTYGDAIPNFTGKDVYLVDYSYKREDLVKVLDVAASVTIIDHHVSAMKDLEDFEHPRLAKHFDMNHSGAVLAYKHCFPNHDVPLFFRLIEDRDLWKFRFPESKAFNANLASYDYSLETWYNLYTTMHLASFIKEGEAIVRKQDKDLRELLPKVTRRAIIAGFNVPVANLPYFYASEAGSILAQDEPFAVTYYDTKEGRMFSFRSTAAGEDVSIIASQYGGGGHREASGAKVSKDHYLATM